MSRQENEQVRAWRGKWDDQVLNNPTSEEQREIRQAWLARQIKDTSDNPFQREILRAYIEVLWDRGLTDALSIKEAISRHCGVKNK